MTQKALYLIKMRPIGLSEVKLLFLPEPTELRFDHSLLFAEGRQIEEVKPFASVTCRWKISKCVFSDTIKTILRKEEIQFIFGLCYPRVIVRNFALCDNYAPWTRIFRATVWPNVDFN